MIENQGFTEENAIKSGSPQQGEPLSVAIGKIRRPHGVKGEVVFEPYPEYSHSLKKGKVILVGNKKEAYSIQTIRKMDQNYLILFDGLDDCDKVSHLRNQLVYIRTSLLVPLPKGHYYPHQVLGMQVVDEEGKVLGILNEVLLTGANDVYVIKNGDEEEVLLPAIESVIIGVDCEKKVVTVRLPIWD
jgi:16S rRNA processing protein RimM